MPMYNGDLLAYEDVSEDWEAGEDCRKCCGAIDDEEWDMIDFEAIREIPYTGSPLICVCYNDDFVSTINEFGGELVDVTFDSSGLGKEEVADHCDIVRHFIRVIVALSASGRRRIQGGGRRVIVGCPGAGDFGVWKFAIGCVMARCRPPESLL
jgi:hypothetical protein